MYMYFIIFGLYYISSDACGSSLHCLCPLSALVFPVIFFVFSQMKCELTTPGLNHTVICSVAKIGKYLSCP